MSWNDREAIDAERFDADIEMAELQAAGNRASRKMRQMKALRAAGKLAEAADACPHGGGYPLNSPAATNNSDPKAGESGYRCVDCGSRLDGEPWGREFSILVPCEIP